MIMIMIHDWLIKSYSISHRDMIWDFKLLKTFQLRACKLFYRRGLQIIFLKSLFFVFIKPLLSWLLQAVVFATPFRFLVFKFRHDSYGKNILYKFFLNSAGVLMKRINIVKNINFLKLRKISLFLFFFFYFILHFMLHKI